MNIFLIIILNLSKQRQTLISFTIYTLLYIVDTKLVADSYYIGSENTPSYLKFRIPKQTTNHLIHHNFIINFSLSKIDGTLLYAIDRFKNQLIISLQDDQEPTIKIEFRTEIYYETLPKLCGCSKRCKYQPLQLNLTINGDIRVQCNSGPIIIYTYKNENLLNKAYPVVPFEENDDPIMWVVNTPQYDSVYPNNEQLTGCIFNITYNEEPLKNVTLKNINRNCSTACFNNPCSSGICYETYNSNPICDCSNIFKNGQYCKNDPLNITNRTTRKLLKSMKFKELKLLWQSGSRKIFKLYNEKFALPIYVKDKLLMLKCEYGNELSSSIEGKILQNYISNTKTILKLKFEDKVIIVDNVIFPINYDLSKETFKSMDLLQSDGVIDVEYKTSFKEYSWNSFSKDSYVDEYYEAYTNFVEKILTCDTNNKKIIPIYKMALICFLSILLIIEISLIVKVAVKKKSLRKSKHGDNVIERTSKTNSLNSGISENFLGIIDGFENEDVTAGGWNTKPKTYIEEENETKELFILAEMEERSSKLMENTPKPVFA